MIIVLEAQTWHFPFLQNITTVNYERTPRGIIRLAEYGNNTQVIPKSRREDPRDI